MLNLLGVKSVSTSDVRIQLVLFNSYVNFDDQIDNNNSCIELIERAALDIEVNSCSVQIHENN